MWNAFKVWIPAQTFNFLICPMWARVSFTALVSFGFTAYVSYLRGAPEEVVATNVEKKLPAMQMKKGTPEAQPIGVELGLGCNSSCNI